MYVCIHLFIYFRLCWVFAAVHRLSLVALSGGYCLVAELGLLVEVASLVEHRPIAWSQQLWRRRQWHPTPVLLPGESQGWRSLVCSPWGLEESDTTERLHFHFSLLYIREGNGNPLQCSCLENPRDGSLVGCSSWDRTESDTTKAS